MNFNDKQLKELIRLYPKIRIPYIKEYQYYLDQLGKTIQLENILNTFRDCIDNHGDVENYKMSWMNKLIDYFKKDTDLLERFNNVKFGEYKSDYPKQFNNWKADKLYVSLDVNEANWSIFKHTLGLELPQWSEFLQKNFGIHAAVANSKPFRQVVMGNLNPSRQQTFQKRYMDWIVDIIRQFNALLQSNIVMLSADEILFEFDRNVYSERVTILNKCMPLFPLAMKDKTYCVERVDNFGDSVLIKVDDATGKKELFSVNGSRYFMHYKTLILGKEIDDRDLLFEPEPKRLAKWIL